jgi:serine/threonine protein kinase
LAILYEAFLHALLYKTLEAEGFPSAVPYLYEVVAHTKTKALPKNTCDFKSVWITMEFIHGNTLEKYFRKYFVPIHKSFRASSTSITAQEKKNDLLLMDVMIQLAFYLKILQDKVRFNHRDMKINNVFMRHHDTSEAWERNLVIPNIGTWACHTDTVLIDFGFSCISCGSGFLNPRSTLIGAGSWFKPEHDCLKYGRDLAQFLYSIHCFFPLQDYISAELYTVLHSVMRAEKSGCSVDLFKGLDHKGNPIETPLVPRSIQFNHGIYIFLRESDVDVPGCRPEAFFEAMKPLVDSMA